MMMRAICPSSSLTSYLVMVTKSSPGTLMLAYTRPQMVSELRQLTDRMREERNVCVLLQLPDGYLMYLSYIPILYVKIDTVSFILFGLL